MAKSAAWRRSYDHKTRAQAYRSSKCNAGDPCTGSNANLPSNFHRETRLGSMQSLHSVKREPLQRKPTVFSNHSLPPSITTSPASRTSPSEDSAPSTGLPAGTSKMMRRGVASAATKGAKASKAVNWLLNPSAAARAVAPVTCK